jgi:hypothetical protein
MHGVNSFIALGALGLAAAIPAPVNDPSSTSRAGRPSAVVTAPPVALRDTVVTIEDLGIQPAVLKIPVKVNPDFQPNVTSARAAAEAKYIILKEIRRRNLERQNAEEVILQKRGGRPAAVVTKAATGRPKAATTSAAQGRAVASSASSKTSSTTTSTPAVSSTTSSSSSAMSLPSALSLYAKNILLDSEFLSEISIGSNNDTLNVIMDTGSADLWMFSTECQTCNTGSPHNYYKPKLSNTFVNTTTPFELRYGDGSYTAGTAAFDTVTVAGAPIQGQSIDVPYHISENLLSNAMDGIMGLGFPSLSQLRVPTPLANMLTQKLIPKAVLGLQYIKTFQWSYDGGGGYWTFGGWDTSVIVGALTWVPIIEAAYWKITLPRVRVGSVYSYAPSRPVIVDSGTTLILLDPESVANIHKYLPGGRLSETDGTGHWQIFCNATSDAYTGSRHVYFNIGGKDWGVPARDLAWYPERAYPGYCYSQIQPWNEPFGILGVAFLKNVYAVFDQDNTRFGLGVRSDVPAIVD